MTSATTFIDLNFPEFSKNICVRPSSYSHLGGKCKTKVDFGGELCFMIANAVEVEETWDQTVGFMDPMPYALDSRKHVYTPQKPLLNTLTIATSCTNSRPNRVPDNVPHCRFLDLLKMSALQVATVCPVFTLHCYL